MGTLVSIYIDNDTFLSEIAAGADSSAPLPALPQEVEPSVAHSLQQLLSTGLTGALGSPESVIFALHLLCRARCDLAGEIDHFSYDDDDFPELAQLQYADTTTPYTLPVEEENGLPSVNHLPMADAAALRDLMSKVDLEERPAYTQSVFTELLGWLEAAQLRGRGVFVFTE